MPEDEYNKLVRYFDQRFAEIKKRLDGIDAELRRLDGKYDVDGTNRRLDKIMGGLEDVTAGQDALMSSRSQEDR